MSSINAKYRAVVNEEALLNELISLLSLESVTDALEHYSRVPDENLPIVKVEVKVEDAADRRRPKRGENHPDALQRLMPGVVVDRKKPRLITADPYGTRQLIDQQLLLCLHAFNCQHRETDSLARGRPWLCDLPHCKTMKNVIKHMASCSSYAGEECTVLLCSSYFKIIDHWEFCRLDNCRICPPSFEQAKELWRTKMFEKEDAANCQASPSCPSEIGKPAGSASVVAAARILQDFLEINQPAGLPRRCLQPEEVTAKPLAKQNAKDWHNGTVSDLDIRNQLLHKVVQALVPDHDPEDMSDKRTHYILASARGAEYELYKVANSRAEYFHLLAETVYELRKNKTNGGSTTSASKSGV